MPRHAYEIGRPYAGRLLAAAERPIENENRAVALVRLEFEVVSRDDRRRELRSLGRIASRGPVLGPDAANDSGVLYFSQRPALGDSLFSCAAPPRSPNSISGDCDVDT